tara:strand:- start:262 stop:1053 length:792 start_codon:yes stop_codon:yes gene_type:complete
MQIYNFLKFDLFFKFIIIFLTFLTFEGFFHYYYFKISQIITFLEYRNQTGYNIIIWNENGLVEFLQVILLFISIIFIIKYIKNIHSSSALKFKILIYVYFLGILYYFFEEISWGQHIFGWGTPDFFSKINSQNETNVHNTSSIFNELPRNLLLIWTSLSFIFVKLIFFKNRFIGHFIFPSSELKFISFLILFFFIPDFLIDKLDLAPGHPASNSREIVLNYLYEMISFNFIRLSELQELLFNIYITCHSYFLFKRNYQDLNIN